MNRINGTPQPTSTTQALYRVRPPASIALICSNFIPLQYVGGECALRYGLKREVKDKPIADGVDVALLIMQLWSPSDTLLNTRMVSVLRFLQLGSL